jgi:hypothetical protein
MLTAPVPICWTVNSKPCMLTEHFEYVAEPADALLVAARR